jgi:hypothetical protein
MNEMLILGGVLLAGWAGLIWLRAPSSIAFLSLLIGQLLSTEASVDVYGLIGSLTSINDIRYIQATLLLLPLGLTLLLLRNRVAKSKVMIEALPLLFVVALTIVLVSSVIPEVKTSLDMATDDQLDAYKTIVVVAASVSGLLSAWLSYPKPAHKEHGKHGKK